MATNSLVRVYCVVLSLGVGASCSTLTHKDSSLQAINVHSFEETCSAAQSQAEAPPFPHRVGPLDMSCGPFFDNVGSLSKDIKQNFQVNTTEDCMKVCRNTPPCTHFTYKYKSKWCHLKSGSLAGDQTGAASCDSSCFVPGITFTGPVLRVVFMRGRNASDCQVACLGEYGCKAFTWQGSKCTLLEAGFSREKKRNSKILAGPNEFCEHGGNLPVAELADGGLNEVCIKRPNVGSRSSTIREEPVPALTDCIDVCHELLGCSHFTYNLRDKVCSMKEGKPQYESHPGAVTGDRSCDVEYVEESTEE